MIAPDHAHVPMFEKRRWENSRAARAIVLSAQLNTPVGYAGVTSSRSSVRAPSRLKYTFYELYFMNLSKCLLTMVSLARPGQFLDEKREGTRERESGNGATSPQRSQHPPHPYRGVAFVSRSELAILSDGNIRKKLTAGICRAPQRKIYINCIARS